MRPKIEATQRFIHGWQPDLPDIRDIIYQSSNIAHREHLAISHLPVALDQRKSPHMPPIEDQGREGSCTAFGSLAAFQFLMSQEGGIPFAPSHQFQYYNARVLEGSVNDDAGASVRDAIRVTKKFGVAPESVWPYHVSNMYDKPDEVAYTEALTHQTLRYLRILNTGATGEHAIKVSLYHNHLVVFGMSVYESFESPGPDHNGIIAMPGPHEQLLGGHCMAIVGWDDAINCFLVRNSWGAGWGLNGYCYIPYAYLINNNLADDFWTLRKSEL